MTYSKGDVSIKVFQLDGFGIKPSLWIGAGNQTIKVASFTNDDKAKLFCKWLDYMFGLSNANREELDKSMSDLFVRKE